MKIKRIESSRQLDEIAREALDFVFARADHVVDVIQVVRKMLEHASLNLAFWENDDWSCEEKEEVSRD